MAVIGMVQKLNTQMNRVFYSSNLYMQLSSWCTDHSLTGTANFLRCQAQGNVNQMMRLFDYMKKAGANPIVGAMSAPNSQCASLEELFQQTLHDNELRSDCLNNLADEAQAVSDSSTLEFLREIEVTLNENGALLKTLLSEVRKASQAGMGMEQTDKYLANVVTLLH